jgi:putative transposase
MARFARVVAEGVAHHITQRGNARRYILETEAERLIYLDLLHHGSKRYGVALIGFCLMSNHVHLIAIPRKVDSLARTLKDAHGRFAAYWNTVNRSGGHVWQGRYYSCPLDEIHLWEALRYTELNPVRASLVQSATDWVWSSASAHCGAAPAPECLELGQWEQRWSCADWSDFLQSPQENSSRSSIRDCTFSGRPLGSTEFIRTLEKQAHRPLTPQKRGPKPSLPSAGEQTALS